MSRYLLDANAVIGLLNDRNSLLAQRARLHKASDIAISAIVAHELFYGAFNSKFVLKNISKIEDVMNASQIIFCDANTAKIYGQIKAKLKKAGKPIPENDIWIAATALQYDMPLVTRDVHFKNVHGLNVVKW